MYKTKVISQWIWFYFLKVVVASVFDKSKAIYLFFLYNYNVLIVKLIIPPSSPLIKKLTFKDYIILI